MKASEAATAAFGWVVDQITRSILVGSGDFPRGDGASADLKFLFSPITHQIYIYSYSPTNIFAGEAAYLPRNFGLFLGGKRTESDVVK